MKIINNKKLNSDNSKKAETKSVEEEFVLSEEDTQYLYKKAEAELDVLNEVFSKLLTTLATSFCKDSMASDSINAGLNMLNAVINIITPAILVGDYDAIRNEEAGFEIPDEVYETIRMEMFKALSAKYL